MYRRSLLAVIATTLVVIGCVLCFLETDASAQRKVGGELPFANAVEQRIQMVQHLARIEELLEEQNALLRSGELQVIIQKPKQR